MLQFLFNNTETDGSFFVKNKAVMLPRIIQRFLTVNKLLHDGKGMDILTQQLYYCKVVLPLDHLSVI